MNPPNSSRYVLTWSRDTEGNTAWVIDNYVCDNWIEASEWDCEVLHWQELPGPPGGEREMGSSTDLDLPPIQRTQANYWQAKYFQAYHELVNANRGIRRLKRRLDKLGPQEKK